MSNADAYVAALNAAWDGKLELAQVITVAEQLAQAQQVPLAAVLYQTWLQHTDSPFAHAIQFNLGALLANHGDLDAARDAYLKAIELLPAFIQPRLNLALVYERQGKLDEAVAQWQWVDQNVSWTQPENRDFVTNALNNLGRVLETRKQYFDALHYLNKSLSINPQQDNVLHHWVFIRAKQCLWPVYQSMTGVSEEAMHKATSALAMIALSPDPQEQLDAARRYSDKSVLKDAPALSKQENYGHKKLRIGYCSSDFTLHPVSMLMVELFELHDRNQFELYGYCWSPEDGSAMRQRVIASMDQFHRIDRMHDIDAAKLIRSHEIDVLIDLQGQTAGARANIMAYRPAPIQITYLGLPATTGLPAIDYVIADRYLIPEEYAQYYSEKPLYMPDIYQVSDRKRTVSAVPTRASCGLPENAFVFCSFNNNYKYTPEMFDTWMRILQRVPNSVLWLLADNPWAQESLIREAANRGIGKERLVFGGRVAPENYLARYGAADLFLDTFPFNAGTTANDALFMGLPVLTLSGKPFASRMAGALLTAAKAPELIQTTLADYEEKAVFLAEFPGELKKIKDRLLQEKETGALFDTARFAKNLEKELLRLCQELPARR